MRISTALLCDAATVREGLLHVLGGGVTLLGRTQFPAPMLVQLAILIHQHPTELAHDHVLDVIVQQADGERVAEASVAWGPVVEAGRPTREVAQPLVLPLETLGLPAAGSYSIELLIDGIHQTSIPFDAVEQSLG